MSTKMVLQRIYDEGLDILYKLHMRPDDSGLEYLLGAVLNSDSFRAFQSMHSLEPLKCGRRFLFLAICEEFDIPLHVDPDLDVMQQNILEILRSDEHVFNGILYFGSAEIFSLATPTLDTRQRFAHSLEYHVSALGFLNQILDSGETKSTYGYLKEIFKSNTPKTIALMFKVNLDRNYSLHDIYLHKHALSKNFPLVLLDAVTSGHVDLNNLLQHVVCWIFISSSLTVLKKLLSHPKVDPTRWNQFGLYCVIAQGDVQSVIEILKDPRVDPMPYYGDILEMHWQNQGLELVKALFANPNFHRDYNDMRPMKKALQMQWGESLFDFLILDPKVNLGANNNQLLFLAVKAGNSDVVETILDDQRIDLSGTVQRLIRAAPYAGTCCDSILSVIFRHRRVDLTTIGPKEIKHAICDGYFLATSKLLDRLQSNPSINVHDIFLWYVQLAIPNPEIMQTFLCKPYLDPSYNNNEPLRHLFSRIHPDADFQKDIFGFTVPSGDVNRHLLRTTQLLSQDKRVKKKLIEMQLAALGN